MANTTWSAIDIRNATLDASKLVGTATTILGGVRAVDGFTTGKYYWECTLNVAANTDTGAGIASLFARLSETGQNAMSAAVIYKGFPVYVNGSQYSPATTIGTITNGSLIGIACDFGAKLIWFRLGASGSWNAPSGTTNNPATGVGGVSFAAVSGPFAPVAPVWSTGDQVTANFGDTAFAGVVPSGFTTGVPTAGFVPTKTTWSLTDKNITNLSDSKLVATSESAGAWVRTTDAQITGKFYWEYALSASYSGGVGFCSPGLAAPNTSSNGLVGLFKTGQIWVNGAYSGSTLGARTNGDVIGFAVDTDAKLFWCRAAPSGNWNGNASANPATGVGGISCSSVFGGAYACCPVAVYSTGAEAYTANFGDATFTGAVPAGFTSGFSISSGTTNMVATQAAIEDWRVPSAPAMQLTQASVEDWRVPIPDVRVTQVGVEHWYATSGEVQVAQVAIEHWASVTVSPTGVGGFFGSYAPTTISNGNAGAASIYLTPIVAHQNRIATAVLIDITAAVPSTLFKALVYDGNHSTLLATGSMVTALDERYNRLPLTAPLTLTAGSTYYVGYVCASSLGVTIQLTSPVSTWHAAGGQNVSSPANPLATGVVANNALMAALELDGTGAQSFGWGPDFTSGVTLSSSNTIAQFDTGNLRGVRGITTHRSGVGKFYLEISVGGSVNSSVAVGLTSANSPVDDVGLNAAGHRMILASTGVRTGNISTGLSYVSGDTIGIAYDAVTPNIWLKKNNGAWSGDPVAGTGGIAATTTLWPLSPLAGASTGTAVSFRLRDTADALLYAPPSGYVAWSEYVAPPVVLSSDMARVMVMA